MPNISMLTHIQIQLFQRPVVGLGHVLPGGCDVGFCSEQTSKPDVNILKHVREQQVNHNNYRTGHPNTPLPSPPLPPLEAKKEFGCQKALQKLLSSTKTQHRNQIHAVLHIEAPYPYYIIMKHNKYDPAQIVFGFIVIDKYQRLQSHQMGHHSIQLQFRTQTNI